MPIDLNRFIATFFDEAQEHLESIEEMAMALGSGRHDPEVLNSIFRAAHSIKGGGGTFGFTQLAEATHEMETLFDGLRKGKGTADDNTVRLLLDACDVFKAHLARLKAGERGNDPAMDGVRAQLISFRASTSFAGNVESIKPAKAEQSESFFVPMKDAKDGGEAFGLFDDEPASVAARAEPKADEKFGFFEAAPGTEGMEHNRRKGDSSSIRVSVEKIDRIVNLVGELVIAQAMMQQSVAAIASQQDEHLTHSLATLDRNTRDLQQAVMSIRMMPMEFVFSRFPRLVYDVSSKLGKRVHLRTQGHET
ncbi:MAG TPA: Hpt domain-containing protein, partial [Usitatibacter sp.]|nr:Hpt domain-containing protein [Usitatibacter sp.]